MKDGKKRKKTRVFVTPRVGNLLITAQIKKAYHRHYHQKTVIFTNKKEKKKHYTREDSGLDASYEAEGVENVWAPET